MDWGRRILRSSLRNFKLHNLTQLGEHKNVSLEISRQILRGEHLNKRICHGHATRQVIMQQCSSILKIIGEIT